MGTFGFPFSWFLKIFLDISRCLEYLIPMKDIQIFLTISEHPAQADQIQKAIFVMEDVFKKMTKETYNLVSKYDQFFTYLLTKMEIRDSQPICIHVTMVDKTTGLTVHKATYQKFDEESNRLLNEAMRQNTLVQERYVFRLKIDNF